MINILAFNLLNLAVRSLGYKGLASFVIESTTPQAPFLPFGFLLGCVAACCRHLPCTVYACSGYFPRAVHACMQL